VVSTGYYVTAHGRSHSYSSEGWELPCAGCGWPARSDGPLQALTLEIARGLALLPALFQEPGPGPGAKVPVHLNVFRDSPDILEVPAAATARTQTVQGAYALLGSPH